MGLGENSGRVILLLLHRGTLYCRRGDKIFQVE